MGGHNGEVHGFALDAPSSKAYDVVLLVHVAFGVVAVVASVASAAAARSLERARPDTEWPASAVRYFSPGPEIAGRSLYVIPLTGVLLIGIGRGTVSFHDAFVQIGLGIWLVVAVVAERSVFAPAVELRRTIASCARVPADDAWRRAAVRVRWGVDVVVVLVLFAAVIMVAQP
jgi:hypothetical protein